MPNEQRPITGAEYAPDATTAFNALTQFYAAFNRRDLALMAANWHRDEDAAMDNPLGGIARGWEAIRAIYERIFSGDARVEVEFYDYTLHDGGALWYAVGRERGTLKRGSERLDLAIRTTRIFRAVNGVWQQVHHHGSIEDPELLRRYQALVRAQ